VGAAKAEPWWKSAAIYQIYPRSFADYDGDGVGDLEGIRRHLDHLAWLGVDALWISPFYRSPMADFGYDVADHCDVDPLFGNRAGVDRLITEAHALGLRVILDLVPNHTSDQHPWFVAARSSPDDPHRDWYIWRDGPTPPNNWVAAFTNDSAWTLDPASGQWYLHLFLPEQPDLNWDHPAVPAAMHDVMRFWIDRGVDGFRVDVVHAIGKDPALPDDEPPWAGLPHCVRPGAPSTHDHIREMRRLVDSYSSSDGRGAPVLIGETAVVGTELVAPFYGDDDELHLAFNFAPLHTPWDAERWRRRIERVAEVIEPVGWPSWVLSNHDNERHRTRYGGSEARARAAAVLLLTLRGTPFVYAGEELGLEDAVVPPARVVDPGGRDGCRAPVPWDATPTHGWATADAWLPWPPEPGERNAEVLRADPTSILHLYRDLLALRRTTPALSLGTLALLDAPDQVVAYDRSPALASAVPGGDAPRRILICFAGPVDLPPPLVDGWVVELASDGSSAGGAIDALAADTAVILRPA
jgi:alpha-glucosidase